MASLLRFADNHYFLSGNFEKDLEENHPILVDPSWRGTKLERELTDFPLPQITNPRSFSLVTSGSTGLPKLVPKDLDQIHNEIHAWLSLTEFQTFSKGIREVFVQVPFCHLYGLLWGYLLPKALGIPIRTGNEDAPTDPETLWITSAPKLQLALQEGESLPERAIVSGMKFPVPLARALREREGISILEIYGSTETGGMGYRDPLRQNRFQILQEVRFRFRDEAEEKELQIQSPFLSKRFYTFQNQVWESVSLPQDGYYATGDLGDSSELGFFLLGRKDRIIKHKGKRVSLDRIESEILGLGLVGQFVSVPIKQESGDTIGIFTDSTLPIDQIYRTLRHELPSSHVPRVIVIQKSIPKLPNGKTDYVTITKLCLEEYLRLKSLEEKNEIPITIDGNTTIAMILKSILGYEPKPNDHFVYDCGMDSILFTEMVLKLEKKLGSKIPEEDKQTGYFVSLSGLEEYVKEQLYLQ
ncbi:non-ribosomal peptide synthetase [Leptospira jelokensis]|uniref:Acyl-CoA synthetase n=1 Tax=Leptospira jelokensis TaxID=2484931 RepID=A0A4Z0ZQB7_9LEPT|nr:non-ribosomal peptide synthetase [Leptospira jelokensis]TGL62629.1 acyl-CoA synthetase [Leptospira jelokensis]